MTSFDWNMSADVYEDMVSCLLSNLNPKTLRIDGSGGDGGRDVLFDSPDGLQIYELKSFTGRMAPGRRTQVQLSLAKAATHNPVRWELVVPINPTVGELKWFDGLRAKYAFPIGWLGKTWLDARMLEHPSVWRHYREGAHAEVVDLLRELHQEEAGIEGGMPDVMARARKLIDRANKLDPHFEFDLAISRTGTKVSVIPRYAGALEDRPITTHIEFRFDTTTPEGKAKFEEFQLANDFGTPMEIGPDYISEVVVNAPAGLGGTFTQVHLKSGPGRVDWVTPCDFEFVAVDEAGEAVARLVVTMEQESAGKKGVILVGHDRSGLFSAKLIFGPEPIVTHNVQLALASGSFVPHELLEAVRFFAAMGPPNRLAVRAANGLFDAAPVPCPPDSAIDPLFVEFVVNLALIQAVTGIVREVTGGLERDDFANASAGAALIRGEQALMSAQDLTLRWDKSPAVEYRRGLAADPVYMAADFVGPTVVRVCGVEFPIGRKRRVEVVGRVDPDVARMLLDENAEITKVVLHPEPGSSIKIKILEK